MSVKGLFIDANLLVLLVVGSTSKDIIAKHKRTRQDYSIADYDFLLGLLDRVDHVLVTPHTLAETSNLLAQHGEPERSGLFAQLRHLIHESREVVVSGAAASSNRAFTRLGITDAALLEAITEKTPLLTVDLDLYHEAQQRAPNSAVNFNYLRGF